MRTRKHNKRIIVEDCFYLSCQALNQMGYFRDEVKNQPIRWQDKHNEFVGRISISISLEQYHEHIVLEYFRHPQSHSATKVNCKVDLESTPCFFGGKRWWFKCPLVNNDIPCRKRVAFLYLTDGLYFGCRHCQNLTYRSSQQHDKRIGQMMKNPDSLHDIVKKGQTSELTTAFRAQLKLFEAMVYELEPERKLSHEQKMKYNLL